MESYEVVNCYTLLNETGECREVLYRTLDYTKAWAELARQAEILGIEIPDGEEWFNAPGKYWTENYYMMEKVQIDE